jgi:lysophospholipase L1-like esterase
MKVFLKKRIPTRLFSLGGFISGLAVLLIFTPKPRGNMDTNTLLCLGDSYTAGESVSVEENFPKQTIKMLRAEGYEFETPDIVAKTGWTTDELQEAINNSSLRPSYNFVTLLIGVNNQYRERPVSTYAQEFEALLKRAIQFAGGNPDHVIVLSIPDWSVTPFATNNAAGARDPKTIAREIDQYNASNKAISGACGVNYIDITSLTREAIDDSSLIAFDGLHPSAKEYMKWAGKLSAVIKSRVK